VRRRRRIALVVLALALLALAGAVRWASRPQQVQRLVLSQAGRALGLQITAGSADYQLRGTPRLVLHDVVAKQADAPTPVLTAQRIDIRLPWSTLRSRGAQLDIQRIELDAPRIDLRALQRWQASRPPSAPPRIPTLEDGLHVRDGRLDAAGWGLTQVAVELPYLKAGAPLHGTTKGLLHAGTTRVPFDLHIALSAPASDAALGASGRISVETPGWQLPMTATLSARLASDDTGFGLRALRYAARARLQGAGTPQDFSLGLAGNARYANGAMRFEPMGVAVHGRGTLPRLQAHGTLDWGTALALDLTGVMEQWPTGWPSLPAPLDRSRSKIPFQLAYAGPTDLSASTHLLLQRDAARFDARFHLPAVLQWVDHMDTGSPLPPLDGTLTAPRLELAGAVFEGVEVQLQDDAPTTTVPVR